MKTALAFLAFFVLCAASAMGQSAASISSQAQPVTFPDHPEHAQPHEMATQTPIVGGAVDNYSYAQGEQPLWQFGPVSEPVPLGDVARAYRREKLTGKKPALVLEKQGS
jgi:hypothetical protein